MMRRWGLTPTAWRDLPEDDRDLMRAEDELVCSQCGNLVSVCSDPTVKFYPAKYVCYASAAQEWGSRRLRHKQKSPDPESARLHPMDGVTVYVSEFEPDPEKDEFA